MKSRWQLHEHFVDKRLGMYIAKISEPESEAEHRLQAEIGHDSCPHCGHVRPKTNLGDIDPHVLLNQELAALQQSHDQQDAWARKHNIPFRKKAK